MLYCRSHGVTCAMPDGEVRDFEFSADDDEDIAWDCDVQFLLTNESEDEED